VNISREDAKFLLPHPSRFRVFALLCKKNTLFMKKTTHAQGPLWEVFTQKKSGQPYQHVGSLHAFDKEMALQNARDLYTRRDKPTGLWVVPAHEIIAVAPGDAAPFFDPSDDKVYRHPTFYEIPVEVINL
jgi:ring-1,2-phenylacetyl-CoA epoxidase subunit PaaB